MFYHYVLRPPGAHKLIRSLVCRGQRERRGRLRQPRSGTEQIMYAHMPREPLRCCCEPAPRLNMYDGEKRKGGKGFPSTHKRRVARSSSLPQILRQKWAGAGSERGEQMCCRYLLIGFVCVGPG